MDARLMDPVLIGLFSTATMDAAALLARRLGRVIDSDPVGSRFIGRWIGYMPHGTFSHKDIRIAAALPLERPIGLAAHYTIGAMLGIAYFVILTLVALPPSPWAALLYGAATTAFPALIVHPAYGLGVFASHSPNPLRATLMSLIGHLMFGAGIAIWTAILVGY